MKFPESLENKNDTDFVGNNSELTPVQYSPNQSDSGGQFLQQKNIYPDSEIPRSVASPRSSQIDSSR